MKRVIHREPTPNHPAWPNMPCCNKHRDSVGLGHGHTIHQHKVTCEGSKK